MSFKQKFSITLVITVFTLLIVGILYSYQYDKANPSQGTSTQLTPEPTSITPNESEISFVTRIIDGDTFEIETKQKVRLIGIDTPELNKTNNRDPECFGTAATQQLSDLILNKKVRMEKDISQTDRFGRLLRYVYIDDIFVNRHMVQTGYAYATTYPPDVKFKDTLALAQKTAERNKRGLWKECN